MNKIKLSAVLVLVVAVTSGCVVDSPTTTENPAQAALTANRLSANGLVANKVVATAMADNSLTIGRRSDTQLVANPVGGPLLATVEGRDYFSYMVSCSMPEGMVVEASAAGTTYQFAGSLGLAPDWEYRAMTTGERRWVSACLLARVNAYGISVPISLRADHPALTVGAEETAAFGQAEGAFYGNVFATTDQKMEMVACRGAAQAAGEGGGLVNRDCAEPGANGLTVCGFRYAGDCLDYTPQTSSAYACSFAQNGLYQDCHNTPSPGIWTSTGHGEVITVYVANQ